MISDSLEMIPLKEKAKFPDPGYAWKEHEWPTKQEDISMLKT